MTMKRSWIAVFAILACLTFAWATGAGRPYPATAGGVIDPTCTSSLPCIEYDNNGTGPGIRGISVAGNGLAGSTKNAGTSVSNGKAGLIGNDIGTGSFNSGVHGLSVSGTGVSGASTNGVGVQGTSTKNNGVYGVSNASGASGVFGLNSGGFGVAGTTTSGIGVRGDGGTNGVGVLGLSIVTDAVRGVIGSGVASSFHAGVAGLDVSTSGTSNQGVYGQSTNGIGIQAVSSNFIGEQVSGGGKVIGGPWYPALSVNNNGNSVDLIDACGLAGPNPCTFNSGQPAISFELSESGNITITGQVFTSGFCHNGCASSPSVGEKRVRLFTPQESLPTVEDFGQAQLVGGRTYVHIDPAFANTMDEHTAYMVLITPEGDSNGLYVVNKTAAGFEVQENRGGRSTLAFSYRIVAKPFGEHPVRLQMITVSRAGGVVAPAAR